MKARVVTVSAGASLLALAACSSAAPGPQEARPAAAASRPAHDPVCALFEADLQSFLVSIGSNPPVLDGVVTGGVPVNLTLSPATKTAWLAMSRQLNHLSFLEMHAPNARGEAQLASDLGEAGTLLALVANLPSVSADQSLPISPGHASSELATVFADCLKGM